MLRGALTMQWHVKSRLTEKMLRANPSNLVKDQTADHQSSMQPHMSPGVDEEGIKAQSCADLPEGPGCGRLG